MKFWNKSRNTRLRNWTCVKLRINPSPLYGNFAGWTSWPAFADLKTTLQRQPGKGKFYMNIMDKEIWFENPKDATWVALKYSEILR